MQPKKILFVNVPADGHFNPLTGLAVHLKNQGHDVRWYTQDFYKEKIEQLGIPYYPFVRPPQLNQANFEGYFTKRKDIKSQIGKFKFDLEHVFIRRGKEYYYDIKEIHKSFPFDLMIADVMSTVIPFVKEGLKVPVIAVGVVPLAETSKDLPPAGMGLTPAQTWLGKKKQPLQRWLVNKFFFGKANKLFRSILKEEGITAKPFGNMFDLLYRSSTLVLQSGTPGFEFTRSDLGKNIRFTGPLLPYRTQNFQHYVLPEKYKRFEKKILVTQGTVEKDPNKIIKPTLEAFRNTDILVIATTGGSKTKELKALYPDQNFIIEDFIPFGDIMPQVDVYITNGGYGGVLLGIENKLPMIVGGIHEGKVEINARVGYFKLGVNLKTETPHPGQIRNAVYKIFDDAEYKANVTKLSEEFNRYNPAALCEQFIAEIFGEDKPYIMQHRLAG